jgi:hypothetical protein
MMSPMAGDVRANREGYRRWSRVAWATRAGFRSQICVSGVLAIFFAWGLHQALQSGRGSLLGPLLIAAYGLGLIVSGVFVTDAAFGYPPGTPNGEARITTMHGVLHVIPGTPLTFVSPILASLIFGWRFWRDNTTRRWAIYSLSTPVLVVLSQVVISESSMGLSQRIAIIVLEVWLAAIAAHFLVVAARSPLVRSG